MFRNVHEHCGVKTFNGTAIIDGHRGAPCTGVARYSGTFEDSYFGGKTTIGLCEQHATGAFEPVIMKASLKVGTPATLISMHSMDREVYERNLARASFAQVLELAS